MPADPRSTLFDADPCAPFAATAVEFTRAMVDGDFVRAHSMMSADLRGALTVEALCADFESCLAFVERPLSDVEVAGTLDADELDPPQATAAGWAYLTIQGANTYGGLAIVASTEDAHLVVSEIQWGRP